MKRTTLRSWYRPCQAREPRHFLNFGSRRIMKVVASERHCQHGRGFLLGSIETDGAKSNPNDEKGLGRFHFRCWRRRWWWYWYTLVGFDEAKEREGERKRHWRRRRVIWMKPKIWERKHVGRELKRGSQNENQENGITSSESWFRFSVFVSRVWVCFLAWLVRYFLTSFDIVFFLFTFSFASLVLLLGLLTV